MQVRSVMMLMACLLGLNVSAGETNQYFAVRVTGYNRVDAYQVMTPEQLATAQAEMKSEAAVFSKALMMASQEWRKDETLRMRMFPASYLSARKAAICGTAFADKAQAEEAVERLISAKKQGNAINKEIVDQAVTLLTAALSEVIPGGLPSSTRLTLQAGTVIDRTADGKSKVTYHVSVPANYNSSNPPPLLVVFSPGGDGRGMMNAVKASADKVGWMVVGCDVLKNDMSDKDGDRISKDLLDDIHKCLSYNRKRFYYGGFSGGAMRSYRLSYMMKDRCCGILAFGGWLGGKELQKEPYQRNMSVAMVNGSSDKAAMSWELQDSKVLRGKQCRVKVFHFDGGHQVPGLDTIDKAIRWLDTSAGSTTSQL